MPSVPAEVFPNTLPAQPTTFIGRKQEIARFCALLQRPEVRLLTLTGPAGVGKTRLALQMGAAFFHAFSDGVVFVSLASVTDPQQVIIAIRETLSLIAPGTLSPRLSLEVALKEKQLLLILDNFEQVVEAGPTLASLLAACPNLKVLVTSRVGLHLQAEWEIVLPPLALPPSLSSLDPDQLLQYEAIALFVARAQAANADFQVTPVTASTIATICSRLDGLPLALELAAARIKYFSPAQLLAQLGDALAVLSQGARDLPPRQRTLRGALAWSYQLLSPPEQQLFRRLAVFAESWDEEAAATVCTAAGPLILSVQEGILSLVDKSLLWPVQQDEGAPRFRMLQLLREFGLSCLQESGETDVTREAHAAYYLRLAEQSLSAHDSVTQKQWHDRLEREHHNLRAALTWLLEPPQGMEPRAPWSAEPGLRLCVALSEFWRRRGYLREARTFFVQALTNRAGVVRELQAQALVQLFLIETTQDNYEAAEAHLAESLALYESLGDKKGKATCLTGFARLALIRCEFESVRARVAEIAGMAQETGENSTLALALTFSARASLFQCKFQEAQALLKESFRLYQAVGDPSALVPQTHLARLLFLSNQDLPQATLLAEQCLAGWQERREQEYSAFVLNLLGQIHLSRGEVALAEKLFEQSLEIVKGTLDQAVKAEVLMGLARVRLEEHDPRNACRLARASVTLFHEIGSQQILPAALEGWGFALALSGERVPAVRLWGAALARRENFGLQRPPIEQAVYERWVVEVRSQLTETNWASALEQGRRLTLEEILTGALEDSDEAIQQPDEKKAASALPSPLLPSGLTPREQGVLRLLAQGLTNAQIAEQLVISPRTVTTHLTSIYGKISVSSRSAATRYAIENHLL